jgi:hypothetical protein
MPKIDCFYSLFIFPFLTACDASVFRFRMLSDCMCTLQCLTFTLNTLLFFINLFINGLFCKLFVIYGYSI